MFCNFADHNPKGSMHGQSPPCNALVRNQMIIASNDLFVIKKENQFLGTVKILLKTFLISAFPARSSPQLSCPWIDRFPSDPTQAHRESTIS